MAFAALLKSSSRTLMTTVAVTAIGFFTSVITARILGPEGRGLLSGALLIATLAGNASLFGLANSFIYHKGAGRPFNYGQWMVFSLVFVACLSVMLAWLGMNITDEAQLHAQLPLILLLTAATAGQGYFYALSQLHDGLHFFNLMRFLLVVGNLVLLLGLVAFMDTVDFRAILITQLIVAAALTLLGLGWAKRNQVWRMAESDHPPATWKGMLGYGASHHGTVLLSLFLVNFDKIALLNIGTIVEYGFYALAFTTSRLIGAVQEAVSTALYSRFAGKDVNALSHHVRVAFRVTFVPMLLLAALGAALSPWLIKWVYGESFVSMTIPFAILLFECVITGASWTLAQRFNAGGRPGLVFVRQFISVVPVFIALPFLPKQDIHIYLSMLMLFGAVLRLTVTLGLYPFVLKERMPEMLPTMADCTAALRLFTRRSYG
ncbi:MAG TPA: oligosaccharide flippase family protein [Methylophilaceae bacterium]|jgi:antigen flippase|nr:oligosaccharide flippase family protein [Methylophilaceae bacterium]